MKLVFLSNFFNHVQVSISDAFYELCDHQYYFIETTEVPEERRKGGFDIIERPYVIRTWKGAEEERRAHQVSLDADVLICGSELLSLSYKKERLSRNKLTFEYSERWFKRGFINLFSKTNVIDHFYYHTRFRKAPLYKLCSSAYTPNDEYAMRSFKGKCYKYGYFPQVKELDIDRVLEAKDPSPVKIIWCARFLGWKHPEMVVDLARRLSETRLDVEINMVGTGALWEKVLKSIVDEHLEHILHLVGGVPNEKVLDLMQAHHIFLLTSDRQEGWGVVVNEAMANGCCVVSSDAVGSVPYLIEDGVNGRLFRSEDGDSLYQAIYELVVDRQLREQYTRQAYKTISEEWSPQRAAARFLELSACLLDNRPCSIDSGPCSPAAPYHRS